MVLSHLSITLLLSISSLTCEKLNSGKEMFSGTVIVSVAVQPEAMWVTLTVCSLSNNPLATLSVEDPATPTLPSLLAIRVLLALKNSKEWADRSQSEEPSPNLAVICPFPAQLVFSLFRINSGVG